jgi:CO/xanthine dehydrogenase FAD-binding subunit
LPDDVRWFEPGSVEEAIELLQAHGEGAILVAGGTEVLVKLNQKILTPACLIDILHIPSLQGIEELAGQVRLGPAVTCSALRRHPLIHGKFNALYEAAGKIGGIQIQNSATIGGNLCNAEPCADGAAACMALHARVSIQGSGGGQELPVEKLFLAPGKTILAQTDILTGILLPCSKNRFGSAYEKLSLRKAMDQALVGVGASLELENTGDCCRRAGIGLATAAPIPMRAVGAEELLRGQEITPERIRAAAEAAAAEAHPRDSRKATGAYRRAAIQALTEKALTRAWVDARSLTRLRSE